MLPRMANEGTSDFMTETVYILGSLDYNNYYIKSISQKLKADRRKPHLDKLIYRSSLD